MHLSTYSDCQSRAAVGIDLHPYISINSDITNDIFKFLRQIDIVHLSMTSMQNRKNFNLFSKEQTHFISLVTEETRSHLRKFDFVIGKEYVAWMLEGHQYVNVDAYLHKIQWNVTYSEIYVLEDLIQIMGEEWARKNRIELEPQFSNGCVLQFNSAPFEIKSRYGTKPNLIELSDLFSINIEINRTMDVSVKFSTIFHRKHPDLHDKLLVVQNAIITEIYAKIALINQCNRETCSTIKHTDDLHAGSCFNSNAWGLIVHKPTRIPLKPDLCLNLRNSSIRPYIAWDLKPGPYASKEVFRICALAKAIHLTAENLDHDFRLLMKGVNLSVAFEGGLI